MAGARAGAQVGCCGFPVARAKYFENFEVVELQSTFYQLPKEGTPERWRAAAPEGFEFTVKVPQLITHEASSPTYRKLKEKLAPEARKRVGSFRPTEEVFSAWERTLTLCRRLKARVALFQSPPSFRPTPEHKKNLKTFFGTIERGGLTLIWEPRGSWQEEEVLELCRELGLVHGVDPFTSKPLWGEPRYFRLHGRGGYRHKYSDEELKELKEMLGEAGGAYVLFNNVFMFEDAQRFKRLL
ncbi:MAG: DUF72 domain-containing protein [Nitrospinota bacterium]